MFSVCASLNEIDTAMCCQSSINFWDGIDKDSYYWSEFNKFANNMRLLEKRNSDKSYFLKASDWIIGRNTFKY